jgi:DNA-binding SARP family transcriptional activator
LFGSFRVLTKGVPLAVRRGGKVELLLGNLAMSVPSGLPRDELLGLIWPDSDTPLATQSLNSLVYSLHKTLGPALADRAPIVQRDGRYRLNLEYGVGVDVIEFDAAVEEGDRSFRAGDVGHAIDSYRGAIELYTGDLVIGPGVQHLVERERLRARFLSIRAHLADHHFARGEYDQALENARQLLAHDPCREDAHRMAMRCYVRLGARAQAVRQYRICRVILADEFDAPPEDATERLYELVRLDPGRV